MDVPQTHSDLEVAENHSGLIVDDSRMHYDKGEKATTGPAIHGNDAPEYVSEQNLAPKYCGLSIKRFWIVVGVVTLIIVAAAVGGGVGGSQAAKNKSTAQQNSASTTETSQTNSAGLPESTGAPQRAKSSPLHQNSSLSALQWIDQDNTNHYSVFFQHKEGHVLVSEWRSNATGWDVSQITDTGASVKLGTPLVATGGYPHANLSWDFVSSVHLVQDVFYLDSGGAIYERQSPYKEVRGVWGNDNASGQFSASKLSRITALWYQRFSEMSTTIAVLFQDIGANSLVIASFRDGPWGTTKQSIEIQDGSPLALAPTGLEFDYRLYMGDGDGNLQQYRYSLDTDELNDAKSTAFQLPPEIPICIATQNNTSFWTPETMPECSLDTPLTHIILFATPDRSGLTLVYWNCSDGFVDQSSSISSLVKPNRSYLGLASHNDGRMYILYDAGDGPQIDEWQVPDNDEHIAWSVVGPVPVNNTQT
ncbi:hypothetical protein EJ04DRAFT_553597 [Polyplosphaeria fusca]|uniref:Fucose-specific lectin n=1 Tax=Polyplosphaeria fusca TaxID=682080 RepID=A0A9P4QX52_9PLEO|nr:hypothetical protein EJ04DRAFT_553597 [Polyplosphaeria fusca]